MPRAPGGGGGGAGPDAPPAGPPCDGEDGGVRVQGAACELLPGRGGWGGRGSGLAGGPSWQACVGLETCNSVHGVCFCRK